MRMDLPSFYYGGQSFQSIVQHHGLALFINLTFFMIISAGISALLLSQFDEKHVRSFHWPVALAGTLLIVFSSIALSTSLN